MGLIQYSLLLNFFYNYKQKKRFLPVPAELPFLTEDGIPFEEDTVSKPGFFWISGIWSECFCSSGVQIQVRNVTCTVEGKCQAWNSENFLILIFQYRRPLCFAHCEFAIGKNMYKNSECFLYFVFSSLTCYN